MNSWLIGRGEQANIRIDDGTVSREHADLVETSPGHYLLADLGSSGGTYRLRNGNWERLVRGHVSADDQVKLGEWIGTVADLLASAPARSRVIERNPETGEIVRRR